MKQLISGIAAVAAVAAGVATGPASAAGTAHVRGPGKLLAPPLIYRDVHHAMGDQAAYVVYFRVKRSFSGKSNIGSSVPGILQADDASDDHDGYGGAFGPGIRNGKCYWWFLQEGAKDLDATNVGDTVDMTFKLHHTTVQHRTVKLRALPAGKGDTWIKSPSVLRALRHMGCRMTVK